MLPKAALLLLATSAVLALPNPNPNPVAAPAPAPTQDTLSHPFTLSVGHNHDPALKGAVINAASRSLFIGLKQASSFCPTPPVPAGACPKGDQTVFVGGLSMDVEVPGGQQAYVDPTGALGYTGPHSAFIPPGSFVGGFSWTPLHTNSVLGQRGTLDFHAPGAPAGCGGFWACPDVPDFIKAVGGKYQVFGEVPGVDFKAKGCVRLGGLRTTEFKAEQFGAWEYT